MPIGKRPTTTWYLASQHASLLEFSTTDPGGTPMRNRGLVVCTFVLGVLFLAGCGRSSPETPTSSSDQATAGVPAATASEPLAQSAGDSSPAADSPTPAVEPATAKEDVPDPLEIKANQLADQLLAADETSQEQIAEQLRALEDHAVPALLARLIDADQCRAVILNWLHQHTGFTTPCELMDFSIAVMPAQERANGPYQDHVVPQYQLDKVLLATGHVDPMVRRGAVRYLQQLGYVGDDRLAVADVAWSLAQADPDPLVRHEAQVLRASQTEIALAMTTRTLLPIRVPTLPLTAEWLAHLGAEAVRQAIQAPYAEARIAQSLESTREYALQNLLESRRAARREFLDQMRADIMQDARERRGYVPRHLRRVPLHNLNLAAVDQYINELHRRPDEQIAIQASEQERLDNEETVEFASLAINVLQSTRDARLLGAMADDTDVNAEDVTELTFVDNPIHRLANELAAKFYEEQPARAKFWADEAIACYRDWPTGLHPGYFRAIFNSAAASAKLGNDLEALATLDLAPPMLATSAEFRHLEERGTDARKIRAALHGQQATILARLNRAEEAEFYRSEQERFSLPTPTEKEIQQAESLWEEGSKAYDRGEYEQVVESLMQARSILDPPNGNTLSILTKLLWRLGQALRETGRLPEARWIANQGMLLATIEFGQDSHKTAPMVLMLGSVQRDAGELDVAEQTLLHAKELYLDAARYHGSIDSLLLANCDYHFGLLRAQQGQIDEARKLLKEARDVRRHRLGAQNHFTQQAQQALDAIDDPTSVN